MRTMSLSIADKLLQRQHEFLTYLGQEYTSFSPSRPSTGLSSAEAHHRIKNNLQMISSLIHLQARQATHPEAKEGLILALARLETFTRLHDTLSRNEHDTMIDLGAYFNELADALRSIMDWHQTDSDADAEEGNTPGIRLYVDVPEITIPSSLAVDMGMALNELVTNAFKHAFPKKTGEIRIRCQENENFLDLYVNDDGQGLSNTAPMPETFRGESCNTSNSLGMSIVQGISAKHEGTFTLSPMARGTQAHIRFPRRDAHHSS